MARTKQGGYLACGSRRRVYDYRNFVPAFPQKESGLDRFEMKFQVDLGQICKTGPAMFTVKSYNEDLKVCTVTLSTLSPTPVAVHLLCQNHFKSKYESAEGKVMDGTPVDICLPVSGGTPVSVIGCVALDGVNWEWWAEHEQCEIECEGWEVDFYIRQLRQVADLCCDFTLVASGGEEFRTHKIVLAISSKVWREVLSCTCPVDRLKLDESAATIDYFLQLIYGKDVEATFAAIVDVWHAADKYQVDIVKMHIKESVEVVPHELHAAKVLIDNWEEQIAELENDGEQ